MQNGERVLHCHFQDGWRQIPAEKIEAFDGARWVFYKRQRVKLQGFGGRKMIITLVIGKKSLGFGATYYEQNCPPSLQAVLIIGDQAVHLKSVYGYSAVKPERIGFGAGR